jgi:hypothetical protein
VDRVAVADTAGLGADTGPTGESATNLLGLGAANPLVASVGVALLALLAFEASLGNGKACICASGESSGRPGVPCSLDGSADMHTFDLRRLSRESSKGVSESGLVELLDETSSRARVLVSDGRSDFTADDGGGIDFWVLVIGFGLESVLGAGAGVCA